MKNKFLILLLAAVLLKGIVWLILTPIFQIPDEPSHFSYTQFLGENKRPPHPRREVVTSQELMAAAKALNFDWRINHPVWRGYQKGWQEQLRSMGGNRRSEFVDNPNLTSLKRPGLYYFLTAWIYRLFDDQNFLWRFYAVRVFSLLLHLLTVWLVFLTAKKLFKEDWPALAGAAWVGFQPGLSFISSGVSYEPLATLAATTFFYLVAVKVRPWWLIASAAIGILVKPDLIFLSLLLPFVLPKKWRLTSVLMLVLIFFGFNRLLVIIEQVIRGRYLWLDQWFYWLPLKDFGVYSQDLVNLIGSGRIFGLLADYWRQFFAIHYHQIFAWYWGVFGWLEKTLPAWVYTSLKITTLLSFVGLIRSWSKIKWLVLVVVVQAGVVIANDFLVFAGTGQLFGIQGRYFYPAIGPQMILLTLGLSRFISPKILAAGALLLNFVGLYTLYQYFGNVWQ